jgi:hypothetical protein
LIKHYLGEETTDGLRRNRQVKEVLRTVQKIAGEVSDLNIDTMREILALREGEGKKGNGKAKVKGKEKIKDEAVLTVGEVVDFMKIASCN